MMRLCSATRRNDVSKTKVKDTTETRRHSCKAVLTLTLFCCDHQMFHTETSVGKDLKRSDSTNKTLTKFIHNNTIRWFHSRWKDREKKTDTNIKNK